MAPTGPMLLGRCLERMAKQRALEDYRIDLEFDGTNSRILRFNGEVAVRTRPTCSPYHREGCVESERTVKIKHANKDLGGGNFLPAYVRLWHLRHAYSCAKKPTVARRGSANANVAVL